MQELIKYFIGILVLISGLFFGNLLKNSVEKSEIEKGQIYFKIIFSTSILLAIISFFFKQTFLVFGFLFVGIVTSKSLKRKKK